MKGYVTTHNLTITGYLLYSNYNLKMLYLDYIGVNPLYQGQGIGKILMNTFLNFTSRMRLNSFLDVEKDTPHTKTLISWYTKNGFYVLLERKEDNVDLVCMIRLFF